MLEYYEVFLEMVEKAQPLSGDALNRARQAFEEYSKTVVDHALEEKSLKCFLAKRVV